MDVKGTLYFFSGKMGAGKTTYSKKLAKEINGLYISEDDWLATFYPDEIKDFNDYLKYSMRIKPLVKELVSNLLNTGVSVIMDFPGNTKRQRTWFKEIFSIYNANHKLVYLKANDQLCLNQIEQRRISSPERQQFDTKEVFYQVTSFFQAPSVDEGFSIEIIEK